MLDFIKSQYATIPEPTKSFAGQTVIVTGSNTGLGLEAARHFHRLGAAKLILAVRTIKKGEEAKASIEASTGREGVVEVWQLDMSNYDSVMQFAKRCESLDRLDVVVENAGVSMPRYTQAEGTETTITVNVISTFLLALNLLPILRKSGNQTGVVPHLVITSSAVHEWAKFNERHESSIFDACAKNDAKYQADRYMTSKLLEVFFVRALASAMKTSSHASEPIIFNTVNPGLCHSELARDIDGIQGLFFYFLKLWLARTTEVGGRTLVASAEAGEESYGQYMSNCVVKPASSFVRSEDGIVTQKRVFDELMEILKGIQPGIEKNI